MMGKTDPAAEEKTAENETKTPVDPAAQQKIERARDRFIERLVRESPRIGVVYETMEVAGGTVKVRVASEALAGEVQRVRTETLSLLAVIAGVRGPIELEVAVDETIGPARPIKTEDKLHHLVERNPNLAELRKTLDLDI